MHTNIALVYILNEKTNILSEKTNKFFSYFCIQA